MKIEVPFVYEATATRHRHRKSERVVFADKVVVEMAEIAEADAPLVAVLKDLHDVDGDRRQTEVRSFDGRPWIVEKVYVDYDENPVPLGARDITAEHLVRELMDHHARDHLAAFIDLGRNNAREDFKDIKHDARDYMCEALDKAAEGRIVVGGHVWRPISAPVLKIEVWTQRDGTLALEGEVVFAEATSASLDEHTERSRRGDRCFLLGIADLPMYEAILERVSDTHAKAAPRVEIVDDADVRTPSVFGWSIARRAMAEARSFGGRIAGMDEDVVIAWATLKKAARKVAETEDLHTVLDKDVDNILEAWKNFDMVRGEKPADAYLIARDAWAARPVALLDVGLGAMAGARL